MMKSRLQMALVTAVTVTFSLSADARPQKVDYHGSICQKLTGGSVTYDPFGVFANVASLVICPLDNITFNTDTSTATTQVTFKVRYKKSLNSCELRLEGTTFTSIPSGSFPPNPSGGIASTAATAYVTLPTSNPAEPPTSISLGCDMPVAAMIGTIQVTTGP